MSKQASHYEIRTFDLLDVDICADSTELQDRAMAYEHVGRSYAAFVIFTDGTSLRIAA
jgi:hypothetical protein